MRAAVSMIHGPWSGEIGSGCTDRGTFRDRSYRASVPWRNNHSSAGSHSKAVACRVSAAAMLPSAEVFDELEVISNR